MTTPTLDIILPVWNNPTETRSCLVSLLPCIESGARLLLINNGCNRETELLLEEFSDPLGSQAVYMTMERNVGFVPAVNHGLRRSDAAWALVLRPSVVLHENCYNWLAHGSAAPEAGILTPFFPSLHHVPPGFERTPFAAVETNGISFDLLCLSRALREAIGTFDEMLDGGAWCLEDYRQRACTAGFRTCLVGSLSLSAGPLTLFGSEERRRSHSELSRNYCRQRWGLRHHVALYLPGSVDAAYPGLIAENALAAARRGHCVDIFLHRRQYREAQQSGLHQLHTDVRLHKLPLLAPRRSLTRRLAALATAHPELLVVRGVDGIPVPGYDDALPATVLADLGVHSTEA